MIVLCKYCKKEQVMKEIRTVGYIYCCGELQVDLGTLRPRVLNAFKDRENFFRKLNEEIERG